LHDLRRATRVIRQIWIAIPASIELASVERQVSGYINSLSRLSRPLSFDSRPSLLEVSIHKVGFRGAEGDIPYRPANKLTAWMGTKLAVSVTAFAISPFTIVSKISQRADKAQRRKTLAEP
jgi:hypothetical protein